MRNSWILPLLICQWAFHPVSASAAQATISPATETLMASQSQQFTLTSNGPSSTWVWAVNGVNGGNATVGTISSSGLYTAAETISDSAEANITATSTDKPIRTATATVSLQPPTVLVSPSIASVVPAQNQQFTAKVPGNSTTPSVAWSLSPQVGSISSDGLYKAPPSVSAAQQVTVTASASGANPGSATITLGPPVLVSVTPSSASLIASQTQQFTATVTGTTNAGVTWLVNPAVGSVSSRGLYTAPSSVTSQQT